MVNVGDYVYPLKKTDGHYFITYKNNNWVGQVIGVDVFNNIFTAKTILSDSKIEREKVYILDQNYFTFSPKLDATGIYVHSEIKLEDIYIKNTNIEGVDKMVEVNKYSVIKDLTDRKEIMQNEIKKIKMNFESNKLTYARNLKDYENKITQSKEDFELMTKQVDIQIESLTKNITEISNAIDKLSGLTENKKEE